jgi:hypothetical protein
MRMESGDHELEHQAHARDAALRRGHRDLSPRHTRSTITMNPRSLAVFVRSTKTVNPKGCAFIAPVSRPTLSAPAAGAAGPALP